MCMTSAITEYAHQRIPQFQWTLPVYNEFKVIIEMIEALDRKLGQPDCVDPAKAEYLKQIEERLSKLEMAAQVQGATP